MRILTVLCAVALSGCTLLGDGSAMASPQQEGYVRLGVVDGDVVWGRSSLEEGVERLSVRTTGRDGNICNTNGPRLEGILLCNGGVLGEVFAYAMPVAGDVARVELDTDQGTVTLQVVRGPGTASIAFGVLRAVDMMPMPMAARFFDAVGSQLPAPAPWRDREEP